MSHDDFHRQLQKRFGARVQAFPEYVDVPVILNAVVADFFSRLAALDPDVSIRGLRIWHDDKLRISVSGSLRGLDDIIAEAEDAAAKIMTAARFPLAPESAWHADIVSRFGDAVPPITRLRFRRGLQPAVFDMFTQLADLDRLRHVDILGIVTRNAAFTVIDARISPDLGGLEREAVDFTLEATHERLAESCEHCGRYGEIVAKTGLEALLDDPDAILGDRFLCSECYESWSRA